MGSFVGYPFGCPASSYGRPYLGRLFPETWRPQDPPPPPPFGRQSGGRPNQWSAANFKSRKSDGRTQVLMQHSRAITRKSASNLALAFVLLPKPKRDAMSALYAFCREVDDVADEDSAPVDQRRQELAHWRADVKRACENQTPDFPVNRELQPVIREYSLPFELFDEIIKGCEMDLDVKRYEDFERLEAYCYRVASAVGLLSIEIFGYSEAARTRAYAIHLGRALQLTNILRDVKTDAARGRIYLPLSELKKFNVSEDEILKGIYSDRYLAVAESVAARAKDYYRKAREALTSKDEKSMATAELMRSVYWRLLEKLERKQFNVFGREPVRLNKLEKGFLALFFMVRGRPIS
jgi:15-cis-phytoene synthase